MKAEEKRLQEIEDWISIHSTNRIIAQKIYSLEKENEELKAENEFYLNQCIKLGCDKELLISTMKNKTKTDK